MSMKKQTQYMWESDIKKTLTSLKSKFKANF